MAQAVELGVTVPQLVVLEVEPVVLWVLEFDLVPLARLHLPGQLRVKHSLIHAMFARGHRFDQELEFRVEFLSVSLLRSQ